jgi:hypothetical protein
MTRIDRRHRSPRTGQWNALEALEPRCLMSAPAQVQDDLPVITLVATNTTLNEAGDTATLEFTRSGPLTQALTVFYSVEGTANTDINSAPINFRIGQETVRVTVTAFDDDLVEGEETVIVNILSNAQYTLGDQNTVTLIVGDNDNPNGLPVITVTGPASPLSELGGAAGFVLSRTAPFNTPLTVTYTVAGTAQSGSDYQPLSGTVTFASNSTQAIIPLTLLPDDQVEGPETVQVVLGFGSDYVVGDPALATATIIDGVIDPGLPLVRVTADPVAQEGGAVSTFTFTRTGSLDDPLTVAFALSGGAIEGQDYENLVNTLTFPAGQATATLTLTPIDDSEPECAELVTLTLQGDEDYRLPSDPFATVLIRDNDMSDDAGQVITLGDGGAKSIVFTDADGTVATLKLTRGAAAVQMLGDNIATTTSTKGVLVTGSNLRIGAIDMTQSSMSTALKVAGKGGNGRITAGRIRSDNSVGQIRGKVLDIGCEVFINGQMKKLDLGSTAAMGNTVVWITGSGAAPGVTFDQVRDLTFICGSSLKQFRANAWLASANGINQLTAPSVGKVQVRGDFAPDMTLTDAAALASIKSLKVTGHMTGSTIRAASSVKQVAAQSLRDGGILVGLDASAPQGSVPASTALFANRAAVLGRVKLSGASGSNLSNSVIAAWTLGRADLREIQTDNNGTPLGVSAGKLGRLSYLIDGQPVRLVPAAGSPVLEQHEDFVIRQVGGVA